VKDALLSTTANQPDTRLRTAASGAFRLSQIWEKSMTPSVRAKQRNRVSNTLAALPAGILAVTLLAADLSGTAPSSTFIGEVTQLRRDLL